MRHILPVFRLPLGINKGNEERFHSRLRVNDARLVLLSVEGVEHYGHPICPLCQAPWVGPVKHLDQCYECLGCKHEYLTLAFAGGEKGVCYVTFPWAE